MFQMQHNAYMQQQHSKVRIDGEVDHEKVDDQHVKKEEDVSSQLNHSNDWWKIFSESMEEHQFDRFAMTRVCEIFDRV